MDIFGSQKSLQIGWDEDVDPAVVAMTESKLMAKAEEEQCAGMDSFWGLDREAESQRRETADMVVEDSLSAQHGKRCAIALLRQQWKEEDDREKILKQRRADEREQRARHQYMRDFFTAESSADIMSYAWPTKEQLPPDHHHHHHRAELDDEPVENVPSTIPDGPIPSVQAHRRTTTWHPELSPMHRRPGSAASNRPGTGTRRGAAPPQPPRPFHHRQHTPIETHREHEVPLSARQNEGDIPYARRRAERDQARVKEEQYAALLFDRVDGELNGTAKPQDLIVALQDQETAKITAKKCPTLQELAKHNSLQEALCRLRFEEGADTVTRTEFIEFCLAIGDLIRMNGSDALSYSA